MTDYDFRTLSPVDFEHLARDVLNAELGLRLQSYPAGRDQGVDLRQVMDDGSVIVAQCKHYLESSESTFLRAVGKEGQRGKDLRADRYLFVTSRPLTPRQQDKVVEQLAGLPIRHDDVWGKDPLNAALGSHPEVERRHIKLWIPSAEVLDTLIRSGQWQRSEALVSNLADRAKVWVHTAAYDQVLDLLEREGVCIVSGPPGVGKSLLAGMVLVATAHSGWRVVDVTSNIEEAWESFRPVERQIFYYDDFLGEFGVQLTKNEPRSLNAFLDRVRQFKDSKRILLTTRDYELRRAANGPADQLSELARRPLQYKLRLDAYDLGTRTKILFNHLYFSGLPGPERERLAIDNQLISIVEHPSYSPRIVADAIRFAPSLTASDVISSVRHALANPRELLNGSFRSLSALQQHILLTLATMPNRPWPTDDIRRSVALDDALDWTPALRELEPTWLHLTRQAQNRFLTLAHPGCRDYLLGMLDDAAVADQQLDRVASLGQLASLARSAGLVTGPYPQTSGTARAELARALTSRRAEILPKIERFTFAALDESPSPIARIRALLDAAALVKALGSQADTGWLLSRTESLLTGDELSVPSAPEGLELAEAIATLPTNNIATSRDIALRIAVAAVGTADSVRDLDAFEALPANISQAPELQAVIRDRAMRVIEDECEQLRQATNDAATIASAAHDLDQRAKFYGLRIDIWPILDHADNLAGEANDADWPDALDEEPAELAEDPRVTMHQLFLQLDEDGV